MNPKPALDVVPPGVQRARRAENAAPVQRQQRSGRLIDVEEHEVLETVAVHVHEAVAAVRVGALRERHPNRLPVGAFVANHVPGPQGSRHQRLTRPRLRRLAVHQDFAVAVAVDVLDHQRVVGSLSIEVEALPPIVLGEDVAGEGAL